MGKHTVLDQAAQGRSASLRGRAAHVTTNVGDHSHHTRPRVRCPRHARPGAPRAALRPAFVACTHYQFLRTVPAAGLLLSHQRCPRIPRHRCRHRQIARFRFLALCAGDIAVAVPSSFQPAPSTFRCREFHGKHVRRGRSLRLAFWSLPPYGVSRDHRVLMVRSASALSRCPHRIPRRRARRRCDRVLTRPVGRILGRRICKGVLRSSGLRRALLGHTSRPPLPPMVRMADGGSWSGRGGTLQAVHIVSLFYSFRCVAIFCPDCSPRWTCARPAWVPDSRSCGRRRRSGPTRVNFSGVWCRPTREHDGAPARSLAGDRGWLLHQRRQCRRAHFPAAAAICASGFGKRALSSGDIRGTQCPNIWRLS